VLISKNRQSVSSVAWIMTIIMLPYVGGLLFAIFGINRVERRAARKERATRSLSGHLPALSQYQLIPGELLYPQQENLMRLASRIGGTVATAGNEIEVLADTNRTLGLIEQAILSAKESLHLEYYIWRPDRTGTRLRDLLIRRAQEGVTVRFLYDKIGSLWLSRRFLKPMRQAGIRVASFLPGPTFRERWSINLRNHRKIVLVDGRMGFTGGMNVGDEYVGRNVQLGYWRDTHLRLRGPTVQQLQQIFAEDWYYATREQLTAPELFPPPEETGPVAAQVLAGSPAGDVHVFHSLMFAAINEAREQVFLATSYFVPPHPLFTALETAAQRGVRVRVLVPGKSAYPWTLMAARSFYESLLAAGVEIYEYQQGLLHSKVLSIDGMWSLVGSPNFDARSLLLNFEVALAIYDTKLAATLEDQFEKDLERSKRIEPDRWSNRNSVRVLAENICRLFSPVM
jgi:cardiolipin synthase